MPKPLVSFIVTTYNLPVTLLEECLNSILSLSLSEEEREIILIDDGSEKAPIDYLQQRDKIFYVRQKNQGVSMARNTGIDIATGQYIQFVDGDDFLLTAPYEHCLDIIRYDHPDMVLFSTSANAKSTMAFQEIVPSDGISYMLNNNLRASVCSYILRRDKICSIRFTPNISHGEDEEFTPQVMLQCKRVIDVGVGAYFYRKREGSATHLLTEGNIKKWLDDSHCVISSLNEKSKKLAGDKRKALERRVAQLTMDYLYNVIVLTHSRERLDETIKRLQAKGLYPLPDRKYTRKYTLFRKMIDNTLGRQILQLALQGKSYG